MSPKLSVVAVLTLVALAGMASVGHADLEPAMGFTGGLTGDDELTAVAVDAAGNYYVAGVRNTRIDLSGTVSLAGLGSFLAKFSPSGTLLWDVDLRGRCQINDIDVRNGWVVAVGWIIGGDLSVDGAVQTVNGSEMMLRLNAGGGSLNWLTTLGAINTKATGVELLGNNWAVVCGDFTDTTDVGTGDIGSNGFSDFFFQLVNTSGVVQSVVSTGSVGSESNGRLAMDSSGNVLFTGSFSSTINFGPTALVSKGNTDICVVKFANLTSITWATSFGGTDQEVAGSVDTDGDDNVFLTGSFENTADFGGGNVSSAGGFDGYIVSLKDDGSFNWADRFGGSSNDFGADIDQRDGRLAIAGQVGAGGDFGPFTIPSVGVTNDVFFAEMDVTGGWTCAEVGGGAGFDGAGQIVIAPSGSVMLGGYHTGDATFGFIDLDNVPFASAHQAFWIVYSESVGVDDLPRPGHGGLTLHAAYPNPFRLHTSLAFEMEDAGQLESARIFDTSGRLIRDLGTGANDSGTLSWDGRDQSGRLAGAGVYFFRVSDGVGVQTRRVTLIR